jgi:hypothetical protein
VAISGGATTAYQMWLEGDEVKVGERGTRLSSICEEPVAAVIKMLTRPDKKSDRPWVAGGDVEKVKALVREQFAEREG